MNIKTEFLKFNWFLKAIKSLNLNLDNEEILLANSIVLRIYTTLQHFKHSLWADFEAVFLSKGAISEVWVLNVLHIEEVGDLAILDQGPLLGKLVVLILEPLL